MGQHLTFTDWCLRPRRFPGLEYSTFPPSPGPNLTNSMLMNIMFFRGLHGLTAVELCACVSWCLMPETFILFVLSGLAMSPLPTAGVTSDTKLGGATMLLPG
jgi:hypothetical protein